MTEPIPASPAAQRFPCPCCGHVVFDQLVGSYEICPVCFWEDDLVQTRWPNFTGGANVLSLIECQRNYQTFGAKRSRVFKHVRAAAEDEPLDPGWYPLGPAALDCFEPLADHSDPWPEDMSVLYWWRPGFWRTQAPRWTGWAGAADLTAGTLALAVNVDD